VVTARSPAQDARSRFSRPAALASILLAAASSGVGEAGGDHDAQRFGCQRDPGRGAAADLAVHVQGQRGVGVQPQLAGGKERRLGQGAAGSQDGVTDRRAEQFQAPGAAEAVDRQQPVVGTGIAGDRPPGVEAAVGDVELVSVQGVAPVSGGDGAERPVPGAARPAR